MIVNCWMWNKINLRGKRVIKMNRNAGFSLWRPSGMKCDGALVGQESHNRGGERNIFGRERIRVDFLVSTIPCVITLPGWWQLVTKRNRWACVVLLDRRTGPGTGGDSRSPQSASQRSKSARANADLHLDWPIAYSLWRCLNRNSQGPQRSF